MKRREAALSLPILDFRPKSCMRGGDDYAQAKILPNVEDAWVTNTPQLVQCDIHLILLTKRNGVWKVNGMTRPE